MVVHNPSSKLLVWAFPISLAATLGIEVSFFSSRYWDVSVPWVSLNSLFIQLSIAIHYYDWVAPFGNLRVAGYLLLTAAYRSLSRPSSAPSAKASALCSLSLDLSDTPELSIDSGLLMLKNSSFLKNLLLVFSVQIVVIPSLTSNLFCLNSSWW